MIEIKLKEKLGSLKGFAWAKMLVSNELKKFFVRALALYDKTIKTSPWRVGSSGGGVPVFSGKLRDSHTKEITAYSARIGPKTQYMAFVHEGTARMEKRPWLDYAVGQNNAKIDALLKDLKNAIIRGL